VPDIPTPWRTVPSAPPFRVRPELRTVETYSSLRCIGPHPENWSARTVVIRAVAGEKRGEGSAPKSACLDERKRGRDDSKRENRLRPGDITRVTPVEKPFPHPQRITRRRQGVENEIPKRIGGESCFETPNLSRIPSSPTRRPETEVLFPYTSRELSPSAVRTPIRRNQLRSHRLLAEIHSRCGTAHRRRTAVSTPLASAFAQDGSVAMGTRVPSLFSQLPIRGEHSRLDKRETRRTIAFWLREPLNGRQALPRLWPILD